MKRIELTDEDIAACRIINAEKSGALHDLIKRVSEETGVAVWKIYGRGKDAEVARARQICMYKAVKAGMSRPRIGRIMHRDHSTVTHGFQAECKRRGEDPKALQPFENPAKMNGSGGVTSATPDPNHGDLSEEIASMADQAIIPIPGQNATPEAIAR